MISQELNEIPDQHHVRDKPQKPKAYCRKPKAYHRKRDAKPDHPRSEPLPVAEEE
jgi:hypothetical protein